MSSQKKKAPIPRWRLRWRRWWGVVHIFWAASWEARPMVRAAAGVQERALWLQKWSRKFLEVLDVELEVRGTPPESGLLAANHCSYLDIMLLSSTVPQVFLAKKEISGWPLFGFFTRSSGSLFINRKKKSDVLAMQRGITELMSQNVRLTIFLEGTSTPGDTVLPFRPSLLEPAIREGWPVTPVSLHYECTGGSARDDIAWWGGSNLFGHFWRMSGLTSIRGVVCYGQTRHSATDRKTLAQELHAEVLCMKQESVRDSSEH